MFEIRGLRRAALGILLFVGACAGGAAPSNVALPPVPTAAVVPDAGPAVAPAAPADIVPLPTSNLAIASAPVAVVAPPVLAPAAAVEDLEPGPSTVPHRPGTEVGYLLIDLGSGQALAELNPDLPLIPASTAKLATAVVALDVLGPEYRYRTELLARGAIEGGTIQGDLILKGNGDPALDVADLLDLAVQLKTSGVDRVAGRFLVDDTLLPRLTEIEPTQPANAPYNPSIGALSLAFNRVRVSWPGGGMLNPITLPPQAGAEFGRAADAGVVWRVADRRRDAVLPVKDPGLHAGRVFRWLALAQGIEIGVPQRGSAPADAYLVALHESAPLRHLLRDMLVHSNNLMAELIGLSAAERLGNVSSGLRAAGTLQLRHLRRLMPEVDWRGAALGNHSGLDGTARLTPRQLAAILRYGWDTTELPALLPAGGWSGTLAQRFNGAGAALRVWAKTGTMNYGSALAGYIFPETGRPALFVTMVSDVDKRAAQDAQARPGRAAQGAAGSWLGRARAIQDDLVESWLEPLPAS